jgi:hypothetical protein
MFPFVLFAYDGIAGQGTPAEKRRRALTIHVPLMTAASLAGLLRLIVFTRIEYPDQSAVHWPYLLLGLDIARRYAWLLFQPRGQTIFHEVAGINSAFDPRALLAVAFIAAAAALAWRLWRTEPLASVGLIWFFLLLVPSTTLIVLGQGEPMAEHRVYLASCGLFLAAGAGIGTVGAHIARASRLTRGFAGAALALVLAAFAAQTVVRNAVWADPVDLWRESVTRAPNHDRPRLLLGEALQDAGRPDEAMVEFRTAVRLRPSNPIGYLKLGQLLAEMGQFDDARDYFRQAIRIDATDPAARQSLAALDEMVSRIRGDVGRR